MINYDKNEKKINAVSAESLLPNISNRVSTWKINIKIIKNEKKLEKLKLVKNIKITMLWVLKCHKNRIRNI